MIKDEGEPAAEECETPLRPWKQGWEDWQLPMKPPEKGPASHLVPRRLRTIYDVEPYSTRQEADKAVWAFEEITWAELQYLGKEI